MARSHLCLPPYLLLLRCGPLLLLCLLPDLLILRVALPLRLLPAVVLKKGFGLAQHRLALAEPQGAVPPRCRLQRRDPLRGLGWDAQVVEGGERGAQEVVEHLALAL